MRVLPSETVNGAVRPIGGYPADTTAALYLGANYSNRFLCYTESDSRRRAGHEHWIMAPYRDAWVLHPTEVDPYLTSDQISGIVWTCTWRALEPAEGNYDWTQLNRTLDRCHELGKRAIIRVFAKTYSGGFSDPAGAIPASGNLPVPDYIPSNAATYGGAAYRGGIYPVYLGGSPVGWGALFERPAVLARWKALVTAAKANIGAHPAFAGWIGPDESTRSAWNGSSLPAEMSFATVSAANREIYQHDIATWGSGKCWPCINYIDNPATPAVANDQTIGEQLWVAQQGTNIAYSDTFPMPETASQFMQPVYWADVRSGLSHGRQVIVHVDGLSLGAPDAGLASRMCRCALQTYRLSADITAWAYFSSDPAVRDAYWSAQTLARAITGK